MENSLNSILSIAKSSSYDLFKCSNDDRNNALISIKNALLDNMQFILEENKKDIDSARKSNLKESMIERLTLNETRIKDLTSSIDLIVDLPNYVGDVIETITRPNGLVIEKMRVPFGVLGVIFESRPNVCVDIACLSIKTSNVCVLKGGKEAIKTNMALVGLMKKAIKKFIPENSITLIESTDREITNELITKKEYIDLLIPRGSKNLINYVVNNSKIPYIETGAGNCHLYINEFADIDKAIKIAINAKYQRPSVCNAIENILVDEKIAAVFLPKLYKEFLKLNIEMRGCSETLKYIDVNKATDEDFDTEYNDYIVAIKVVKNIDEAIKHINTHSTRHSESIITEDSEMANKFLIGIDSACIYHNASTRFTDGGEFGMGAEIGISTTKLHARGPMGLKEIMTYKYLIKGNGQVR